MARKINQESLEGNGWKMKASVIVKEGRCGRNEAVTHSVGYGSLGSPQSSPERWRSPECGC